jgi:hypothetical protein
MLQTTRNTARQPRPSHLSATAKCAFRRLIFARRTGHGYLGWPSDLPRPHLVGSHANAYLMLAQDSPSSLNSWAYVRTRRSVGAMTSGRANGPTRFRTRGDQSAVARTAPQRTCLCCCTCAGGRIIRPSKLCGWLSTQLMHQEHVASLRDGNTAIHRHTAASGPQWTTVTNPQRMMAVHRV